MHLTLLICLPSQQRKSNKPLKVIQVLSKRLRNLHIIVSTVSATQPSAHMVLIREQIPCILLDLEFTA